MNKFYNLQTGLLLVNAITTVSLVGNIFIALYVSIFLRRTEMIINMRILGDFFYSQPQRVFYNLRNSNNSSENTSDEDNTGYSFDMKRSDTDKILQKPVINKNAKGVHDNVTTNNQIEIEVTSPASQKKLKDSTNKNIKSKIEQANKPPDREKTYFIRNVKNKY